MNSTKWPPLPYEKWKDTLDTLHMCMQVAGKVKLALNPFLNHWWQVAFLVTSSGMTTGLIPYKDEAFDVNFDFIDHRVIIHKTDAQSKTIILRPRTVADFYIEFMSALSDMNISVNINPIPCEVPDPVACNEDTVHASYDGKYVTDWWQIMVKLSMIFEHFRTPFRGKSSPVHFFWGSFDLNETRYSGKPATPPEYGGIIMRYAENEENFSFGFWPGDNRYPYPALYSYLYPAPKGIGDARIEPGAASFNTLLGEFILPYAEIYSASSPELLILEFLQSTYNESAKLAGWDIKALEGPVPYEWKYKKV